MTKVENVLVITINDEIEGCDEWAVFYPIAKGMKEVRLNDIQIEVVGTTIRDRDETRDVTILQWKNRSTSTLGLGSCSSRHSPSLREQPQVAVHQRQRVHHLVRN